MASSSDGDKMNGIVKRSKLIIKVDTGKVDVYLPDSLDEKASLVMQTGVDIMAEGGTSTDHTLEGHHDIGQVRLAEGDDLEEQINECIALQSIYENEDVEICPHNNTHGDLPGGIFNIPIFPPQPFEVKITKDMQGIRRLAFESVRGRGRKKHFKKEKDMDNSSTKTEKLYSIKRLPPITLTFAYPHDYPSISPPTFTLSCCWLEKKHVLDFNLASCEVCFEEKAGEHFLRLVNCSEHLLCKDCMKGWLEERIKEGAVNDLRCPGYKCDKTVLPTEVGCVVDSALYQRYEKLLLKTAMDVMADVINCPRPFCHFPVVLEDNLGLCQKCQHAFCGRCQNTYHGHTPCKLKSEMYTALCDEYENCTIQRKRELELHYGKNTIQRALEEVKSNKWLESHSKQCPSCGTFIQKKDGCNKMTCSNCHTFFCWLCQMELSRSNPYGHYQHPTSPCSNRLFEGMNTYNDDDYALELMEEEGLWPDDVEDSEDDDIEFLVEDL